MWTGSRCSSPTTSSTPSSMSTCSSTRGHWTRGYAAFLRVIEHHAPLPCFCGRGALILCAVLRALCQSRPTQTWQAKGNTCSLGAPRWARSKSTHAPHSRTRATVSWKCPQGPARPSPSCLLPWRIRRYTGQKGLLLNLEARCCTWLLCSVGTDRSVTRQELMSDRHYGCGQGLI